MSGRPTRILALLLLALLTCYFRFRVDSTLFSLDGPGLFIPGMDFFKQFTDLPGRPEKYFALVMQEVYRSPWLGAVTASLIVLVLGFGTRALFQGIVQGRADLHRSVGGWVCFLVPALVTLVALNRYLELDLPGVVAALLLALLYVRLLPRRAVWRVPAFVVLFLTLSYADPEGGRLLAAICALWEIAGRKRCFTGIAYAVLGMLPVPFINAYVFNHYSVPPIHSAAPLILPDPVVPGVAVLALILLVFVAVAWRQRSRSVLFAGLAVVLYGLQLDLELPIENLLCFSMVLVPAAAWLVVEGREERAWTPGPRWGIAISGSVLGVVLLAALVSFDQQAQYFLRMWRSCRNRDWPAASEISERIQHATYRAHPTLYAMRHRILFHTGRLPYDLLSYELDPPFMLPVPRLHWGATILVKREEIAETLLDLGLVNFAEMAAYDWLEAEEKAAGAYRVLALVYIVKDNPEAARTMLVLLGRSNAHREWAKRYCALLDGHPDAEAAERVAEIRSVMVRKDRPRDVPLLFRLTNDGWDWEGVLKTLLEINGANRMGFEYLMSYYLMNGQPEVVENLPRLEGFGYTEIPMLYQEAVLMDAILTGKAVDAGRLERLDPTLVATYARLGDAWKRGREDPGADFEETPETNIGSYFSYFMWLISYEQQHGRKHQE